MTDPERAHDGRIAFPADDIDDSGDSFSAGLAELYGKLADAKRHEDVLQTVPDHLSEVFEYVWVGEFDVGDWSFEPVGGSDEGLVAVLGGGSGVYAHPRVERVMTTGNPSVIDPETVDDPTGDPESWKGHAAEHGYATAALVPVVHEGSAYGLIVLGDRSLEDVPEPERRLLPVLGRVVGNALTSAYRREAMLGGRRLVAEFRIRNALDPIPGGEFPPSTEVSFERTVPRPDGTLLQYLTVSGMDTDEFRRRVADFEDVTRVRKLRGDDAQALFETVYTGPSVIEHLVDHDAQVVNSRFVGDDHHTTAVLSTDVDLAAVVEDVEETFPDVELVSQRSLLAERTMDSYRAAVRDRLTDRQRTVVETAYAAGYFERPRASTAEAVATSLGISKSTFSQHVRAAHRKVYGELFSRSEE